MKRKRQDLIYIYDTDHHKVIMIDGETGEKVEEADDRVTAFLKYLDENNRPALLRKFAIWCARKTSDNIKPIQKKMLELAEKAVQNNIDADALKKLYQQTEGTAVASDTVGLQQGRTGAASYLGMRECINPDALEGAIQAARFHRLWAEMNQSTDDDRDDSILREINVQATEDAIQRAEQEQTDYLLDLMNESG